MKKLTLDNKPLFDSPGIVLSRNRGESNKALKKNLLAANQVDDKLTIVATELGETVNAGLVFARGQIPHIHNGEDGIHIFFDGYLTALDGTDLPPIPLQEPACLLAELYNRHKLDLLKKLRGSFVCLIFDKKCQKGWLFNDRIGSRPMFYAELPDGTLLAMPKLRNLARYLGRKVTVHQLAVAEFLISGSYYADHTIFEQIRLFPQAGLLELSSNGNKLSRYWSIDFSSPYHPANESNLVEECDALIEQAVRRNIRLTRNSILSLSGGVDSRILLCYLRKTGNNEIPLLSYGLDDRYHNDLDISRQIADTLNLPLTEFQINPSTAGDFAAEAVWRIDARADTLDAPMLLQLWEQLGGEYDAMFQGDQCFGWHGNAKNADEALALFSRCNLDQAPRVANWMDPDSRQNIISGINETLEHMVAATGHSSGNDVKDILFFEQAIGNIQNAYAAAKQQEITVLRPLLDEDVLEFISRLPEQYRRDKKLLRLVLKQQTILNEIAFATSPALPKTRDILSYTETNAVHAVTLFRTFLQEGLHSEIADWIHLEPILAILQAFETNSPLPPIANSWWQRLPFFSRGIQLQAAKATHPFVAIRRLVVINLFLKSINGK